VKRALVRAATGALLSLGLGGAVVGLEVLAALRRDYVPSHPVLEITGTFGPADGRPVRFVVLGDSTAAGLGAGSPERSYPVLLAQRLAGDGYRVELDSLGVSGARTADVASTQAPLAAEADPDLVLVAIGGNDVTHLTRLASVRRDLRTALVRLHTTGAPVVVAGVPDMRALAFLEPLRSLAGWRGRVVSRVIRDVAGDLGLPYVPLAERTGHFFTEDPDRHFSVDLFHPGPGGYRRWADAIYPELAGALAGPSEESRSPAPRSSRSRRSTP
jgi:lysophospholipase L1-like esterase